MTYCIIREVISLYKEVFKARIKAIRLELGYSQAYVAAETDNTQSNISKYESGDLEPTIEQLGKLAQFYCVSIDWLLGMTKKFSEEQTDNTYPKTNTG